MARLIIVTDYVRIGSEFKGAEILALTHGAQLACEQQGFQCSVPDNLYDYRAFRKDFLPIAWEIDRVLEKLDESGKWTWFPYAWSGNEYWFIVFFANLFYLSKLARRINEVYRGCRPIILHSGGLLEKPIDEGIEFTHSDLNLHRFSFGLNTKVYWLKSLLDDCQVLRSSSAYSLPDMMALHYSKIRGLKYNSGGHLFLDICDQGAPVWVAQAGYEVSRLKKRLPEYKYSFPLVELENEQLEYSGLRSSPLTKDFREFLMNYFSGQSLALNRAYNVFSRYHDCVVRRVRSAFELLDRMFREQRPKAVFYSVGSTRLHEALLGWMANERGVPVFYFDHGGGQLFAEDPLINYQGANNIVSRHHIRRKRFGSLAMYELSKKKKPRTKGILYCPGPPVYHAYKDLMLTCSDAESFKKHKNIVECGSGKGLDIKVHPGEGDSNYLYFRNLCKGYDVRVLYGFPAEEILGEYNLIMLDFLRSALTEAAVAQGVAVEYYGESVETLQENGKRKELQDPGPAIADYVRSLID